MSVTAIAYTIVGSRVDRGDFFVDEKWSVHGGCDKEGPGPFCSACGRPADEVDVTTVPRKGFEPEAGWHSQGQIGGMDIVPVKNGNTQDHFLAVVVCESHEAWRGDGGPRRIKVDLAAARERIQPVLESLGLWEPDNFGIWTALEYS